MLVLPQQFKDDYDPLDGFGTQFPLGSGPARNFAWHHAREGGTKWHWLLDDNIKSFCALSQ